MTSTYNDNVHPKFGKIFESSNQLLRVSNDEALRTLPSLVHGGATALTNLTFAGTHTNSAASALTSDGSLTAAAVSGQTAKFCRLAANAMSWAAPASSIAYSGTAYTTITCPAANTEFTIYSDGVRFHVVGTNNVTVA